MQDILLLYGSPKRTDSATHMLLEALAGQLAGEKVHWFDLVMQGKEAAAALRTAQAAVLAFPLYFDSIPSHVLAWMRAAEAGASAGSGCHVYAVINCGFYEGSQCQWAAQSVQHWSAHCGLDWGQALGIGGGPMLLETAKSGLAILGVILAIRGAIQCFFGYRVLKLYITVIGFLAGLLGFSIIGALAIGSLGPGLLVGLLGGVLMAFIAFKLHKLAVCLVNGANAFLAVTVLGFASGVEYALRCLEPAAIEEQTGAGLLVGLVAGVIVAVLTALLYRPVVILSTALQGGVFLGCGLCMMLFAIDMFPPAILVCILLGVTFQFYNTRAEGRAAKQAKREAQQRLQQDPKAQAQAKVNKRYFLLMSLATIVMMVIDQIYGRPAMILFCIVLCPIMRVVAYWTMKRGYPEEMASVTLGYFLTHPFKKFVTYGESQPAAGEDSAAGQGPEGR